MKFPIALQVYSVRDYAQKDLYGTLKQIKEMGYDGVEFAGLYGHSPAQVKEMLGGIGLQAVSARPMTPAEVSEAVPVPADALAEALRDLLDERRLVRENGLLKMPM